MSQKAGDTILATDFIVTLVAGENVTANDALYIKASDGKAYKTDASDTTKNRFIGFAVSTVSSGANVNVQHGGQMTGFTSLTIGARYFLSATPGAITATAVTYPKLVGLALSATVIKISQRPDEAITAFTASGTYTKASGLKRLVAVAIGPGGSGGSGNGSVAGGGGGGGAINAANIPASLIGTTVAVTVGTGGAAKVSNNQNGDAGSGASSFGAFVVANAGSGGLSSTTGGAGGTATGSGTAGGAGGNGGGGTSSGGGGGGAGGSAGGTGGGSGGTAGAAGTNDLQLGTGGVGSTYGGAGVVAATNYGGGGGGGAANNGGTPGPLSSGAGKDGIVYVIEYFQ